MKKCTSIEEEKGTRYIRKNAYFDIITFTCLLSTKPCLRFQGYNERFPKYLVYKLKFQKMRHGFVDERALIITTLISSCHWKTLAPFCFLKKRPENAFLTLIVNYRKILQEKNYAIQNNSKLYI